MEIKIDFKKMQQDTLIKELKLNEYVYVIGKVEEYKNLAKKQKDFIDKTFKDTYISFYDMRAYCYKKQKNKEKQLSEWGRKFFIYFERLIKEQAKREKDYEDFNKEEEAEKKLEEIIYVLSTMEELKDDDLTKLTDKKLKQIAKDKIKDSKAIHKSFATKLFATLNPEMPVWDSNVSQSLQEKLKRSETKESQINEFLKVYEEIYTIENEILEDNEAIKEIDKCKEFFKEAKEELKNEKFIIKRMIVRRYINEKM